METYVSARHHAMLSEPVEDILPIVVRYVFRGRNAWYSTWATHYFNGCFHDSMESAKRYAESLRGPGNVLYIEEIPAIAFLGRTYCGVVAQINVPSPLGHYAARSREQRSLRIQEKSRVYQVSGVRPWTTNADGELVACWKGVALAIRGHSVSLALASFLPGSPFWSVAQPAKNSVIRAWQMRDRLVLDVLSDNALDRYQSFARGVNNHLGWSRKPKDSTHQNIVALAEELDRTDDVVFGLES